jgi:hypothetical protein
LFKQVGAVEDEGDGDTLAGGELADVGIVGHDHAHLGAELCFGPHGSKKRDVVVELIERVLGIDRRGRQALAGLERVASRDVAAAAMDSLLIGNDCVS